MTIQWARKDPEHLKRIIQLAVERGFDVEQFERTCTRNLHGFAALHDAVDRIDTVKALQDRVHELEGEATSLRARVAELERDIREENGVKSDA